MMNERNRKQGWMRLAIEKMRHAHAYNFFENLVANLLTLLISCIIIVALYKLGEDVISLLVRKAFDPLNHETFLTVFGGIMTLIIAMEFKHSIVAVAKRQNNIIEVKTVILVSILALARKFIILDVTVTGASKIAALALSLISLGIVYWLIRDRYS